MKSSIVHPRLGEITISQNHRARRISISVRPSGDVRLSLPYGISLKSAISFLESKAEWIEQARHKMADKAPPVQVIGMPFATRRHNLRLNPAATRKITSRLVPGTRNTPAATPVPGEIVVTYPAELHYSDPAVQEVIRRGIEKAWSAEAKELLPGRLERLSEASGLPFRSVGVRNSVSRWGSCSSRNDISLSLHLMRLPDYLIDYILLHELCHVKHKDHSKNFYQLLDTLTGGRNAELRRELKKYNTRW